MTFSKVVNSPANLSAWDFGTVDGVLYSQIGVGTASVRVDEDTRQELAAYLARQDKVIISKAEYESLLEDARWRQSMENWGVDNWVGYDEAISEFYGDEDD